MIIRGTIKEIYQNRVVVQLFIEHLDNLREIEHVYTKKFIGNLEQVVELNVSKQKYKFTSKYDHNYDEVIEGYRLKLNKLIV